MSRACGRHERGGGGLRRSIGTLCLKLTLIHRDGLWFSLRQSIAVAPGSSTVPTDFRMPWSSTRFPRTSKGSSANSNPSSNPKLPRLSTGPKEICSRSTRRGKAGQQAGSLGFACPAELLRQNHKLFLGIRPSGGDSFHTPFQSAGPVVRF